MRMRSAFIVAGIIGIVLVGLGVGIFADAYFRVAEMAEVQRVATRLGSGGFRLALISNDVLLHGEVRSERQWREIEGGLRQYIAEHSAGLGAYRREVRNVVDHLDDLASLFGRVLIRIDSIRNEGKLPSEDEVYSLLASQMAIRITELQSAIDEFEAAFSLDVEKALGASFSGLAVKLAGLFSLYALFGVGTWLFFYHRMLRPLSALERTISLIRVGSQETRALKVTDDEIGAVIDAFNDLLDRQQAAEQEVLEKARLLERANTEMEQFVYVASHDLKAPLRGIQNLAGWIEDDLADQLQGDVRENLALLKSRVQRMDALLEGLLQYSRIGRKNYPVEAVDSKALVAEVTDLLALPSGVTVAVDHTLPILVAQKPPLEMVLRNLIGNAVKHHDRPDGRIAVTALDLGDFVEFAVADDGPGIPPEYHEKVFGMFQTLRSRDEVEGSGMGLAIVKRVVEHHGGTIRLESEAGQRGTTFRFTWPKTAIEQGD